MKKILSLLLLCSVFVSLSACNMGRIEDETEESSSQDTGEENMFDKTMKERDYAMNFLRTEGMIKMNGRTGKDGDGIICDNALAGFEMNVRFDGELKLTATATAPLDADSLYLEREPKERTEKEKEEKPANAYFTVYVDGVRSETRFCFPEGETVTLTIAESDGTKTHHIRVVKQTEPQFALATLESISFTGYIDEKPTNKRLLIEVIGDSITTGYGNIWKTGDGAAEQALYQDATQAYPFLVAETLNADVSLVGCSGVGAVRGWRTFPMTTFYGARSYYRDMNTSKSGGRRPDLIIISLGTNDKYAPAENGGAVSDAEFKAGILSFIDEVRAGNEGIPVVLIYGQMTSRLNEVMPSIVAATDGVYAYKLSAAQGGGAGHPSAEQQFDASIELLQKMKQDDIIP